MALVLAGAAEACSTRTGSTYHFLEDAQLALLRSSIKSGKTPATGDEALAILRATNTSQELDAWGESLVYRFPSSDPERVFDLYSKGANNIDDGGNGDDVVPWEFRDFYYQCYSPISIENLVMYAFLLDGPVLIAGIAILWLVRRFRRRSGDLPVGGDI